MPDVAAGRFRFSRQTGEDLPRLARLAYDASRVHCSGCRDYHVMWPYLRAFGANGGGPEMAWEEQLSALARIVAGKTVVRWLLAGSADAGQLALVHAVIGDSPNARHQITIIDRCETPLKLCRSHAAAVGLEVDTIAGDLWTFARPDTFDIILMHHVLLFFPVEEHQALVLHLAGNLAPGGRICMVAMVQAGSAGAPTTAAVRHWREGVIREEAVAGDVPLPEDIEVFVGRLDGMRRRRSSPASYGIDHNLDILVGAGLKVVDTVLLPTDDPRIPDGAARAFRARHILVAERRI